MQDNGVKLVDPHGEMLDTSWESHATDFANAASADAFIAILETFIQTKQIPLGKPARVVYARDTRASGPKLAAALRKGLAAIGAKATDAEITTTPILHYLVDTINTTTQERNVNELVSGYYHKLSTAFKRLLVRLHFRLSAPDPDLS